MPLNLKHSMLAIEAESTPGTAETLVDADATFHVFNLTLPSFDFNVPELERQGTMDMVSAEAGMITGTISFEVPLQYFIVDLAPALGLSVSATTLWAPDSDSSNWGTVTAGYYLDGRLHRLSGCMGNAVWRFAVGQVPVLAVTLSGVYVPPGAAAVLAGSIPEWSGSGMPTFKGDTLTIDGNDQCASELTFDLGNTVEPIEKASAAYGVSRFWIGNRKPTGTINPLAELLATYNNWTDIVSGDEVAISCVYDTTRTLSIPKANLFELNLGERGTKAAELLGFRAAAGASGDDSFTYDTDNSD
ncbi:MAG: phage tail tube protein [Planctomycetota bacterium]